MVLLVGLTGPLGSGKGSVANTLSALAGEHGIRVAYYSLSDEIRGEIKRQETQLERDTLKRTADKFRSRMGNGVWASLVASRIEEYLAATEDVKTLILVDAIRNTGEVRELRTRFGSRFKLLGVLAPSSTIRENLLRRRRIDESGWVLEDEQEIRRLIETEMGSGEPGFGHNVAACVEMADWPPIHNDGSLAELEGKVRLWAEQNILPLFMPQEVTEAQ